MNKFKKIKQFKEAFKKRYNRDVDVEHRGEKDDKQTRSYIKIKSKKKEYILIDNMEEGLTVEANLIVGDKKYKYDRYVDAEIHCADLIGEE